MSLPNESRVRQLALDLNDAAGALCEKGHYTANEYLSALVTLLKMAAVATIEQHSAARLPIKKALQQLLTQLTDTSVN